MSLETPYPDINEIRKQWLENPDFYRIAAKVRKKKFDVLVEEGFTPEQAIQIVARMQD